MAFAVLLAIGALYINRLVIFYRSDRFSAVPAIRGSW